MTETTDGSGEHGARDVGSVRSSTDHSPTGEDGSTTLGDLSRTDKTASRIDAYGSCEEACAAIGMTIALAEDLAEPVVLTLTAVQNDLVDVAADLGSPTDQQDGSALRIDDRHIERLNRACDHFGDELPALTGFIVPGGTSTASLLQHARAVVRRAERATWATLADNGGTANPATGRYLNQLSTLLFILARRENVEHGEIFWRPGLAAASDAGELWEAPPPA